MKTLKSFVAPAGKVSLVEHLNKTNLKSISFGLGNQITGNYEGVESVCFNTEYFKGLFV